MNFIQKNSKMVIQLLSSNSLEYHDFLKMVRNEKKTVNTIANLRELWTH